MNYTKQRPGFLLDPNFHVATKSAVDRRETALPARFPERREVDVAAYRRPVLASRWTDAAFYCALLAFGVSSALLGALFAVL